MALTKMLCKLNNIKMSKLVNSPVYTPVQLSAAGTISTKFLRVYTIIRLESLHLSEVTTIHSHSIHCCSLQFIDFTNASV